MAKERATTSGRLTDTAIRAWLRTEGGPDFLHDGGGLYLRRRADGAFWALRQVNPLTGARTWAGLLPGVPYPDATLAEARKRAIAARIRAVDTQTDLVRERRASLDAKREEAAAAEAEARRRITVRELFRRWAATDLAPRVSADGSRLGRKDGGEYIRQQFERRVFPAVGDVPVQAVTKGDLMAILDAVKADGKLRTANVLLTDLKQMLRFALERDHIERNPLDTVTRRKVGGVETQRDRVLSADEVAALAQAVPAANLGKRSELAVWFILATGCRISEAMGARWEHIDTDARTWHLPITKNERDHTVHLSDFALRQVQALADLRGTSPDGKASPWVFPNSAGDGHVCIKSFGKQLADRQRPPQRRMQHRSKLTTSLALPGGRWTAHDLRRTAATLMAELGVSGDVIDECLNHVIESRVRRTYIRDRRRAEQARAFDALGAKLEALTTGRAAPSNVVSIREAA